MLYRNSTVNIPVRIDSYDALAKSSEKIEVILSLILAEIISDKDLYELVDRIDIKRMSKETDFLSEFAYNFTNHDYVESILSAYRSTDPHFQEHYLLLRELYYHELETILLHQRADLLIEYVFLNAQMVLINIILLD